jgi:hypothetical protein
MLLTSGSTFRLYLPPIKNTSVCTVSASNAACHNFSPIRFLPMSSILSVDPSIPDYQSLIKDLNADLRLAVLNSSTYYLEAIAHFST